MKTLSRARQVGFTAVSCALLLRLFAAGVPQMLFLRYAAPHIDNLLTKSETGRNVRFSSSSEAFSPDFVETPPPSLPEPTMPQVPAFSGEEAVDIFYAVEKSPDIPALLEKPLQWDLFGETPGVLILHTHTTESYTRQGEDYRETAAWRTLDDRYNMRSIGRRVGQLLEEAGIPVIHDEAVHDYPSYSGSYVHARESITKILEEHPGIRLILDLHRDAVGTEDHQLGSTVPVNGEEAAQLMVVIGTNHDAYEENLSLGLKLHALLEEQAPGITRPLQLRSQRFNQDLSGGALLIEVGAAGNSHGEALLAAEELAKALIALARGSNAAEISQEIPS